MFAKTDSHCFIIYKFIYSMKAATTYGFKYI